jgi:hypothetical protein
MRLIGLVLTLSLILASLVAEAQAPRPCAAVVGRPARRPQNVEQATSALKITTVERDARTQRELEQIFAPLSRSNTDGVFIASLNLRVKFHSSILRLATKQRLPVTGHRSEWVELGALFSYAENIREVGRVPKAFGLTVPQSMLLRADRIIE